MKRFKQLFLLSAVLATGLFISSCSDEARNIVPLTEDPANPAEIEAKEPAPGVYAITKFVDTGDDETAQFSGYTFTFGADGSLVASANGQTYNGWWSLNGPQTVMTLTISGTPALDDLDDDDWSVGRITNLRIRISASGPDVVVFSKIQ
jgi:hypothetical protein